MAMRLNAAMKQQVKAKALDHTFKKRLAAHHTEGRAIGDAMWAHLYGEHKRALAKVPVKFLSVTEAVPSTRFNATFTVAGQRVALNVTPGTPNPFRHYDAVMGSITDTVLVDRCRAWQGAADDLNSSYTRATETLSAMLKNIQTYGQLEKEWPEGKKFYRSLPADFPYQHQVPALRVKELNEMLGLST